MQQNDEFGLFIWNYIGMRLVGLIKLVSGWKNDEDEGNLFKIRQRKRKIREINIP